MTFKQTLALLIGTMLFSSLASAADPVTDAMQKAYAPYRVALFKTNSNSQTEAQQAIDQARQTWSAIATKFGATPPAPYDRDTEFASSLAGVSKVYDKAAAEIAKNALTEAHETLEHARDIMADMRHRNDVIVYSDHMNAYHAQMELVLNDGARTLAGPNGIQELTAQTGALEFLAARLKTEAPSDYARNEEFNAMLAAVQKSVADLKAALFSNDEAKVKAALGKVKVPYSRMFIKFG
ncbi:hypothetical protein Q9Q94_07155 [Uliginosibacterium sp. 31-16]|uniref:hypothetical protein n=1 Tax=Uliginosibacterium sp. 31-16 TaxID=3068315 RepID=UPI00273DC120|nr:hypothetical protein [Uliginosibacterium sp. 31-16]MDP5239301.1 hypothetical protein [Uliginosibacterium sp. 31-16]